MTTNGSPAVVRFDGELDVSRKDELRSTLQSALQAHSVLLDLAGVTYADSTALVELLHFCTDLKESDVPVALLIETPQFARLIKYAGLDQVFAVFDNRDEALAYLAAQA
ncbi:MAG TPA: STAS domain-containing protein [Candidatus Eremiobacteraceae bacterium]|nr:STAS domain-containing protein [Candidatus Eremiobacteraceae bacterium]